MANSKRKCKGCGEFERIEDMQQTPNGLNFCSDDCKVAYAIKNKGKGRKIKHRQQKKDLNDNDKPLRKREAQKAFNAFIRLRDSGLPCISCNRSSGAKVNAGHYKSVGSSPELRFEELNVHLQCEHCNCYKSGNIENYRANLIKKIGLDRVEWLEGPHEPKKYTCAELKEIEMHYKGKIKQLKEGE